MITHQAPSLFPSYYVLCTTAITDQKKKKKKEAAMTEPREVARAVPVEEANLKA